jgi:DNA repair exonuclease SbcCD ATPase subunit
MRNYEQMIKDAEWLLKDKVKETETLKKTMGEKNQKLKTLRAKDKELEEARDEIQKELVVTAQSNRVNGDTVKKIEEEIGKLTRDIAEMTREKNVPELMTKQQNFWDDLEIRMRKKIDNLNAGLEVLIEEKDQKSITEDLKSLEKQKINFSQQRIDIKQAQAIYDKAIRNICELSINGQKILPHHKEARLNVLDRFPHLDHIVRHWN